MISAVTNWEGKVSVDGTVYDSIAAVPSEIDLNSCGEIILHSNSTARASSVSKEATKSVVITVRPYMTKPATPDFDFMEKWNHNVPMPYRIMVGTIDKETPGMYHMSLHVELLKDRTMVCMKCGKPLTNTVSQYFGVGPECGGHNYVNPFDSKEELDMAVEEYKKQLSKITWEGWVIKSAITEMEEIDND